jgi:hypothetical protein
MKRVISAFPATGSSVNLCRSGNEPNRRTSASAVRADLSDGAALIRSGVAAITRHLRYFTRRTAPDTSNGAQRSLNTPIPMSVSALVYELLDAHADTAKLAASLPEDLRWGAHLDYLKALQRKGRETLAHGCSEVVTWEPS